jgi:pimeloyl-ACP methyl ester carboxylesterase
MLGRNGFRLTHWPWLLLALWAAGAVAADYAREQKWAEEITPGIVVGDTLYLQEQGGHRFLALYAPAPQAKGAVVLVHGIGMHPDWALINVLRSQLPERGYATLSIQMPVLAADAKAEDYPPTFPEAADRIAAAVSFLRGKGIQKIAVVSHSMGSRMADYFFANAAHPRVAAWVAIGMTTAYSATRRIPVPVLDLYGENDFPQVLKEAPARAEAIRSMRGSAQVEVAGADHYFNGKDADLVNTVADFLEHSLQ